MLIVGRCNPSQVGVAAEASLRQFSYGDSMELATDKRLVHEDEGTWIAAKSLPGAVSKTPEELANIVSLFAYSDGWMEKVRLRADQRWYERLYHGPDHDIWV